MRRLWSVRRMRAGIAVFLTALVAVILPIGATPAGASHLADAPILDDAGCGANTLAGNDDGSTGEVPLPFGVNFYGVEYGSLFVNNNGNVTFSEPLGTYTPFVLDADTPPIIAPFFADVDTRSSNDVTYGALTDVAALGGHDAFCVSWHDVGYYSNQNDKLNDFQLLIVERNDRDPGDFDIYFNYERVLWETGSASGGIGGFGGSSAGAGFSSGTGNLFGFFELPCSRVNAGCLDANADTGLHNTSTTPTGVTPIAGRHLFEVRSHGETFAGIIDGHITRATDSSPINHAWVHVCRQGTTSCRFLGQTDGTGYYRATQLAPGDYEIRAFAPGNLVPSTAFRSLADAEHAVVDLALSGPTPPPDGTTVNNAAPGTIPVVVVGRPFPLVTDPAECLSGGVTYTITSGSGATATGSLTETPPGSGLYSGDITVPFTGPATVTIHSDGCEDVTFNIYIDPSGFVRDTNGDPITGATVTLLYSNNEDGPFNPMPDGDTRMSPANRANPDLTDGDGHFGWDVAAGFYRVRAERDGCTSPDDTSVAFNTTPVFAIPPAVTDIDLRLRCGETTVINDPPPDTPPPASDPPPTAPKPPRDRGTTVGGGAGTADRIAGDDRIATAIEVSQASFPDADSASAAVLAVSDEFADALVGVPLAADKDAPLLLTPGDSLDPAVADELQRVNGGTTVYLLGGTGALSDTVASQVEALGFDVVRYAGVDRYATAVAVAADGLGSPAGAILVTGRSFADALAAGPAAAAIGGAVLLTDDSTMPSATSDYLDATSITRLIAIGGPAALAAPGADQLVGIDRYATAALVASSLFDAPTSVGAANGEAFADGLAGGAHSARLGIPVLFVHPTSAPPSVVSYLDDNADSLVTVFVYGGTAAVSDAVAAELAAHI